LSVENLCSVDRDFESSLKIDIVARHPFLNNNEKCSLFYLGTQGRVDKWN
jgi:hypothetical protein